jgi:hypothetical protein
MANKVPSVFNRIKFSVPATYVQTISPSYVSKNGPFVAVHLGTINKEDQSGHSYYVRPYSEYKSKEKRLIIYLNNDQYPVYKNKNIVSPDILFSGKIIIDNFEYNKPNPSQTINVDIQVINNTGRPIRGIHIHDGLVKDKNFTFYGKICYFLYTTKYWAIKKTEFHKNHPIQKLLPVREGS